MAVDLVKVDVVSLDALTPDPKNARAHTPRNIGVIADSMGKVGAARSGVIDEDGVILAGNGMREGAKQAGFHEAIVVEVDGTRPVFIKRTGLSPAQKIQLSIDDNRSNELSHFDPDIIEELTQRCDGIRDRWTEDEWNALKAKADEAAGAGGHGRGGAFEPPDDIAVESQFGVIVHCASEVEQKQTYDELVARGFTVKVVTV